VRAERSFSANSGFFSSHSALTLTLSQRERGLFLWFFTVLTLLALAGCDRPSDSSRSGSKAEPLTNNITSMGVDDSAPRSNPPPPPPATNAAQNPPNAPPQPVANPSPTVGNNPPPPPEAAPTPGTTQKPAEVGVGKKGRGYGKGVIVTPVASLFAARERLVFEVQIPQAMQLFKAMNDNKGPKSHDEFMQKIVKENNIKLPELPAGDRYMYDPKTEQLMVESPEKE
jgi:hypothetical protein